MSIKDSALGFLRGGKIFASQHSPEILTIVGGISMIGSIISACKATLKAQEVVRQHNERLDKLKVIEAHQKEGTATEEEEIIDIKTDRMCVYKETGKKIVVLYLPAAGMAVGSFVCYLKAVGIVKSWYGAAVATIGGLTKENSALKDYITQNYGPEVLQEIQAGVPKTVVEVDKETGEVTETKEPSALNSDYCKFFDETNPNWEKNAESNLRFLQCKQNYANHILHNRLINVPGLGKVGYLFYNEVLEMIGEEPTEAGQIMGWIYYENPEIAKLHPESSGYIDFGFKNPDSPAARKFVNGYERSVLLNFNVDTLPILGRIGLALK